MGLLSRIFGRDDTGSSRNEPRDADSAPEHAVLLKLAYQGDDLPDEATVLAMHALQDRLDEAIRASQAGQLDGDEFGEGACTVYLYGPDADRLWDAIAPVLETEPFAEGSVAIKRYGEPGAREETIDLAWGG